MVGGGARWVMPFDPVLFPIQYSTEVPEIVPPLEALVAAIVPMFERSDGTPTSNPLEAVGPREVTVYEWLVSLDD